MYVCLFSYVIHRRLTQVVNQLYCHKNFKNEGGNSSSCRCLGETVVAVMMDRSRCLELQLWQVGCSGGERSKSGDSWVFGLSVWGMVLSFIKRWLRGVWGEGV